MRAAEYVPAIKGHWRLDIYDGDVERAALTREQVRENELWAHKGLLVQASGLVRCGIPGEGACLVPVHAGRIVSRPIEVFEGDNLVTTTGKGLILDRLFALASAGALTAMGVGNSATAAAVGDTQLLGSTPSPDLRLYDALPTRAGTVVTAIRTYATAEGNMNWQEIALFNGTTNGTSTMFNRIAPIGAFNKTSAVSIAATVTVTQS